MGDVKSEPWTVAAMSTIDMGSRSGAIAIRLRLTCYRWPMAPPGHFHLLLAPKGPGLSIGIFLI